MFISLMTFQPFLKDFLDFKKSKKKKSQKGSLVLAGNGPQK